MAIASLLQAQTWEQRKLDTLFVKLQHHTTVDSSRIYIMSDISFSYFPINPEEGLRWGNEALSLAEKLKWDKGIGKAYTGIAANYWGKNDFLKAQDYFLKALNVSEKTGDKDQQARAMHNVATVNQSLHNYDKAMDFYHKSYEIYKKISGEKELYGILAEMANVFEETKRYNEALNLYTESLQQARIYGMEGDVAYRLGKIGEMHANLGDYTKALEYENQSLEIRKKIGARNDIGQKYNEIGNIYLQKKSYHEAIIFFQKAIATVEDIQATSAHVCKERSLWKMGSAYSAMAEKKDNRLLHKAAYCFETAIPIAKSVADKETLIELYRELSDVQERLGNNSEAIKNFKLHSLYKDSLYNLEKDREIIQRQVEYEYTKEKDSLNYVTQLQREELISVSQERQLSRLKIRQQFLIVMIAVILLSLIFTFFIFRVRLQNIRNKNELAKEKSEKKLKEIEYQKQINEATFSALRSQMNPHFIFNTLNTIQNYVYSNDKKSANIYLGKFSELMRNVLDYSNRKFILLEEEIELLQLYLDIQKSRFGNELMTTIETEEYIHASQILIPPMLIQPYVENAINHGLSHKQGNKNLKIKFSQSFNKKILEITIDDTGIGRSKSNALNALRGHHSPFGNTATAKRIELINELYENKTTLEIIDKLNPDSSPAGTLVIIRIPVIYA